MIKNIKKTTTIREMNLYRYTKTALSKMTMSFKLTLIFFLIIVFNGNAQTPAGFDLVAYEGFSYTSGTSLLNANGGTGWTSNWEQSYQHRYLKTAATGFSYTGLTTIGNKAEWASNCYGGCNDIASLKRGFPLQNEGVVYFQFISVLESSGGFGTPGIRLYNSTTLTGGFGASTGTKMSILNAGLANLSSSSANLNAQNLVVVRIDYNLNKTEMWINPNLTTFNYSNPTSPTATASIAPEFDNFQLFMRSGSIDEISIFKSVTGLAGLDRNGKITNTSADFVNKNGSIGGTESLSANGERANITLGADGLTSANASTSASQIKQDFPSSVDGIYWITNSNINGGTPFQIYADMTTDGGGWILLNVGAGSSAAPEASSLTSPNVLGYLPRTTVIALANLSTDVQLRAGNSSSSYAHKTTSTNSLAIGALQSTSNVVNGASTWANGASSTFVVNSGTWQWAYCCPGSAAGWPTMYHSNNYTNGVHWFADIGIGRKHAAPRDTWFSTWIR